jgi:hypothetical protein
MKCTICEKVELHPDTEDDYIHNDEPCCRDCWCQLIGDFIEKNPIGGTYFDRNNS